MNNANETLGPSLVGAWTAAGSVGHTRPMDLVGKFASGDPEVVARTRAMVERVVRHRGYYVPPDQRADLVQEVLLQVWQAIGTAELPSDRNFEALVHAISHRRCVDWLRVLRSGEPLDENRADEARRADEVLVEEEQQAIGREIVAKLREGCRELVRLHFDMGLPYGRIAGLLGRSENALRVQMVGCLKLARKIATELYPELQSGRREGPSR